MKYDIEKVTGVPWKKKKSYRYLYRLACQRKVIEKAFFRMRKNKTKRKEIIEIEENMEVWIDKIQEIVINTKPQGWHVENPDKALKPKKHRPVYIREGGKVRVIYKPSVVEQWIHHIIVMVFEPIIHGSAYFHSYSSFPKRGTHKGKKAVRRFIRSGRGVRNFAQCDIRHFYNSVQYNIVREKLKMRIRDELFMHLIDVCMCQFLTKGLPLGYYISQWLANFMLQDLDYKIKCEWGAAHFVRYMDNLTFQDDSKKKLHELLRKVKTWLGKHRLRMKGDWQVSPFDYIKKNGKRIGRRISAMGFYFYRDRTLMRKHIMLHLSRVARIIKKKNDNCQRCPQRLCKSFMSLMGWIPCTNTYNWYLIKVKPYANVRKAKRLISKYDRKEKENDKLGGRILCAAS